MMRLLLTRPATDSALTREKLLALGHQVIVSPVIEIVATGAAWPAGVVDALVATSAHAFHPDAAAPSMEARRLMPLYLVGDRTMAAARQADFLGAATVAKTASALGSALREMECRPGRMVYLTGRERKPDLEIALAEMDQSVDVVEVYDARETATLVQAARHALQMSAVEGVLHFSRRSASLFLANMEKAGLEPGRPLHFCLSEDVATPLRDAGARNIKVASQPSEAYLLAVIGSA